MIENRVRIRLPGLMVSVALCVGLCLPVCGETLAWWRFEEGTHDTFATDPIKDWGPNGQSEGPFAGFTEDGPS